MHKILFILGTRPEAIKLAPLIHQAKESDRFTTHVCSTGQHQEMLQQVLDFFDLIPDYDLHLMQRDQTLHDLASCALRSLSTVMEELSPDLVVVQGDTTTAMIGALAAFYRRTSVAHIEAGLRSNVKFSPYPEEVNRVLVTHLSDFHFAPTERSAGNLRKEGIPEEKIYVVGNTVVDALLLGLREVNKLSMDDINPAVKHIDFSKKIILVTGHRRESFGRPLENVCHALNEIAKDNRVEIIYPVHLNPHVREPVFGILGGRNNIHLIEPVDYSTMIYLMSKSYIILTDSGGVQEEAPSLCKPVLVLREVTERTEGVEQGVTKLVGTSKENIVRETFALLNDINHYNRMATGDNPYGDGFASKRIVDVLEHAFEGHTRVGDGLIRVTGTLNNSDVIINKEDLNGQAQDNSCFARL
ncbi:MAG: UDP-N-acetylglucosamine 2-epimerase (non-hydrolyzing) [Deltaproteobacteria bacterium]|nr:UDP-N-acetylglucosamine 2-epimerase (non-hydrolyzing) [Deltaproteobacteria bacterium]